MHATKLRLTPRGFRFTPKVFRFTSKAFRFTPKRFRLTATIFRFGITKQASAGLPVLLYGGGHINI
jgi:hypothetical protein